MKPALRFVLFSRGPQSRRRHYFRLVARNNKIVAQSEGYNTKAARAKAVSLIRRNAVRATWENEK